MYCPINDCGLILLMDGLQHKDFVKGNCALDDAHHVNLEKGPE